MRYPGGKNLSGCYQRIINQIPPHHTYIEPFLGSGAIMRLKRPADKENIGIDLDWGAIVAFSDAAAQAIPDLWLFCQCGIAFLEQRWWTGREYVYCDPPYLATTLRSRPRYRNVLTEDDHLRLLRILQRTACPVAISGYASELYDRLLAGWRRITYPEITRGGYSIEQVLWCNYPEPTELHDTRYVGRDYRQRENLARKKRRWRARIAGMQPVERQALMEALAEVNQETPAQTPVKYSTGGNAEAVPPVADPDRRDAAAAKAPVSAAAAKAPVSAAAAKAPVSADAGRRRHKRR